MLNHLFKIAFLLGLSAIGLAGLGLYRHLTADAARLAQSEQKVGELSRVIDRLEFERRVADLIVADQQRDSGTLRTRLLMVEYDRDDRPLPPRSFEVLGDQVHVDALVIKFEPSLIKAGDPLRGKALLLFDKIYGDAQVPAEAQKIDSPGAVPTVYRGTEPEVPAEERQLWKQFWQLASDPALRAAHGVRVAHGAGVFAPFKPGVRYTVALGADGNVTLYDEPLPEMLRQLIHPTDAR